MLAVPPAFRAMPRWRWDDPGRRWLQELPALIELRCRAWDLEPDGLTRHGSNALVVGVRRGRDRFALRLAPPGDPFEEEVLALRTWAGRGTVQLVDADEPSRSMLLERLDATRTLASEPPLPAMAVLGRLTRVLAVEVPRTVDSTADVAAGLRDTLEPDWARLGRPTPRALLRTVLEAADERASAAVEDAAVDGDLHVEQVLAVARRRPGPAARRP